MAQNGRDRYFDLLRTLAMVRVILHHLFMSLTVLPLLFPSLGLMFALGGSLMAKSMQRGEVRAVRSRLRRLLPAVWVMALILVPLMLVRPWQDRPAWPLLSLWVFPVALPPASDVGQHVGAGVLWYVHVYIWFVLLSPLLVRMYRLWNVPTVVLSLFCLALVFPHRAKLGEDNYWLLVNTFMYGACWVLGIAHREGDLARLPGRHVLGLSAFCIGVPVLWALTHHVEGQFALFALPFPYAVYMIGFVLVLLRWTPPMDWLARIRPLDGFVSMVNNRAVTIYLWHVAAIAVAVWICEPLGAGREPVWGAPWPGLSASWPPALAALGIMLVLLTGAVLGFGWVEDLAARRRPRISPFVKRRPSPPAPAPALVPVPAESLT
ncbi:acyltransferase [Actinoplanes sp. KI2]|uniref:acyltransferase family protein n=1 Tax=Actinoplanes sp. KI2 TaxID=2983315 RepID=UPI0021D5F706|nr:acyltransferase [Actinoplanes sp. KI2]MCU7725325.1 acyltransferase [Actinoplanes sp. KI2]